MNKLKTRQLLVTADKTFKITVPAESKITFGPWSPPKKTGDQFPVERNINHGGTLRIYDGPHVIAVFSNVTGYRDLSLEYAEMVAKEEGATIWKSDQNGYQREDKVSRQHEFISQPQLITNGKRK